MTTFPIDFRVPTVYYVFTPENVRRGECGTYEVRETFSGNWHRFTGNAPHDPEKQAFVFESLEVVTP